MILSHLLPLEGFFEIRKLLPSHIRASQDASISTPATRHDLCSSFLAHASAVVLSERGKHHLQRTITQFSELKDTKGLMMRFQLGHADVRARLVSACAPYASTLFTMLPTEQDYVIDDDAFETAAKLRLGLDAMGPNFDIPSCKCGDVLSSYETPSAHLLSCNKNNISSLVIERHDRITEHIFVHAQQNGHAASISPSAFTLANHTKGDLCVTSNTSQRRTVSDITVANPLASTYAESYREPLDAAHRKGAQKRLKYEQQYLDQKGFSFTPLSMEITGAQSVDSQVYFHDLTKSRVSKRYTKQHLICCIAVTMAMMNHRILQLAGHNLYLHWAYHSGYLLDSAPCSDRVTPLLPDSAMFCPHTRSASNPSDVHPPMSHMEAGVPAFALAAGETAHKPISPLKGTPSPIVHKPVRTSAVSQGTGPVSEPHPPPHVPPDNDVPMSPVPRLSHPPDCAAATDSVPSMSTTLTLPHVLCPPAPTGDTNTDRAFTSSQAEVSLAISSFSSPIASPSPTLTTPSLDMLSSVVSQHSSAEGKHLAAISRRAKLERKASLESFTPRRPVVSLSPPAPVPSSRPPDTPSTPRTPIAASPHIPPPSPSHTSLLRPAAKRKSDDDHDVAEPKRHCTSAGTSSSAADFPFLDSRKRPRDTSTDLCVPKRHCAVKCPLPISDPPLFTSDMEIDT